MISSPNSHDMQSGDIQQLLLSAEAICLQRGVRLTHLRRRVLEIIWEHQSPLGAYAILNRLCSDDGRMGAPPTVYRALDFLLEHGLIHRLASLNTFIGCRQPSHEHIGQFLVCRDCGRVDELNNPMVEEALHAEVIARRYEVLAQTVEIVGRCPCCQQEAIQDAN
ncbi:MAG: Fur family transcriptional regulator [Candidatus Contendobacter odensis]|uniref:Ferric uptake regulation protein n=1 Tax=Candidatus Contendibacter odensensis TaxID=1400860 RepID=A0A2G6PGD5_9GAMM|nr:MAG: Fur family transcriptional regulator [Candidatus Contendobacter odensis]